MNSVRSQGWRSGRQQTGLGVAPLSTADRTGSSGTHDKMGAAGEAKAEFLYLGARSAQGIGK
jgi:hypothetical protein